MAQAMSKQQAAPDSMTHYRDIGAYLREMRHYYGLSVDDVAGRLHIRNKYIIALEEGRMSDLPGRVYTLGYLQAYAEFLGLDAQQVMHQYQDLKAVDRQKMFRVVEPNQRQGRPAVKVIIASMITLAIALILWHFASKPIQSKQEVLVEPVPERMLVVEKPVQVEATALNEACVGASDAAAFPPCYGLSRAETDGAFMLGPVRSMMELQ